jgi:hypothetical protein
MQRHPDAATGRAPVKIPVAALVFLLIGGCAHSTRVAARDVDAICFPPRGWKLDPAAAASDHVHRVWVSPSGLTAYGVIYFTLPLPVGADLALWGFLGEMKRNEGDSSLLGKQRDGQRLRSKRRARFITSAAASRQPVCTAGSSTPGRWKITQSPRMNLNWPSRPAKIPPWDWAEGLQNVDVSILNVPRVVAL